MRFCLMPADRLGEIARFRRGLSAGGKWIRTIGPWRQAVGPVMENGESFAGACRAGHPTVRRCGDVRLRALVKGSWLGSSVSLWAKPHPWRRATARRFFWLTGQRRVFRRGTKGSKPSPSTSESRANLTSLPSLQGLCAAAYWTPITGAHEVRGAIRDRWAALGWERGSLGYPVSDETNEVDGSGRLSLFEHGAIPPA